MSKWFYETDIGRWTRNGLQHTPVGEVEFVGRPDRAYTIMIGKVSPGTLRRHDPHGWIIHIKGFEWRTQVNHGTGRVVGSAFSQVRLVSGVEIARDLVRKVLSERPEFP